MTNELTAGLPALAQISRGTETMPAWVVEGQPVALVSIPRFARYEVRLAPVKRVTPKFVILDFGHYDRKFSLTKELEEAGQRDSYGTRVFLTDPGTDAVKLWLEAQKVENLGHRAVTAGTAFAKDKNPENAAAAADALDTYMSAWNEFAHTKNTHIKAQGATQ